MAEEAPPPEIEPNLGPEEGDKAPQQQPAEAAAAPEEEVADAIMRAFEKSGSAGMSVLDLRQALRSGLLQCGPLGKQEVFKVQSRPTTAAYEDNRRLIEHYKAATEHDEWCKKMEEMERQEEEEWSIAMQRLRSLNRARSSSRSDDEMAEGTEAVSMEGECEVWEVLLDKANGPFFGFSFSNDRNEYQRLRGKLANSPLEGPEMLHINEIGEGGLAEAWNIANPSTDILTCDRIARVNGHGRIAEMQHELQSAGSVQLLLVRFPQHFYVDLRRGLGGLMAALKPSVTVGITYDKSEAGSGQAELKITGIGQDGLLERWNQLQISRGCYQFVVTTGMRINAVNDVEGDVDLLEQELRSGRAQRLQIRRADIAAVAKKKLANKLKALGGLGGLGCLSRSLSNAAAKKQAAGDGDAPQQPEGEAEAAMLEGALQTSEGGQQQEEAPQEEE